MLSMLGRFLRSVLSTTSLVCCKRQYWFACGTLLLMLNPISASAIPEFVGTFPGSNPLNCTTFAGDSSTSFAGLAVTGGCGSTALTSGVSVSEFRSSTVLFNREWLARVEYNIIVRPTIDELEVTVELTHKVDPHPADGDAGGGPTYSVTYSCTAGGVCAGHPNSGPDAPPYKQITPGAILGHNGPSDHLDIFDSSFSVNVSQVFFCLPSCDTVGWQIDKWRLDITGRHIPEPSLWALLVAGAVALSLGRGRGLAQGGRRCQPRSAGGGAGECHPAMSRSIRG